MHIQNPVKHLRLGILLNKIHVYLKNNMLNIFTLLSASPWKWSRRLKQFIARLPTNCLSVFDHFIIITIIITITIIIIIIIIITITTTIIVIITIIINTF